MQAGLLLIIHVVIQLSINLIQTILLFRFRRHFGLRCGCHLRLRSGCDRRLLLLDHLALCVKLIRTHRQVALRCPAVVLARRAAAVGRHEVVVVANLAQTGVVGYQLTVLHIVQAIAQPYQTSVHYLAVRVEVVVRARQIAVRLPCVILHATGHVTIAQEEVIVPIYLMQTYLLFAVDDIIQFAFDFIKIFWQYTLANSIFTEVKPQFVGCIVNCTYFLVASNAITLQEIIPFSVNFLPFLFVIRRTIIIPPTTRSLQPHAMSHAAVLLEGIRRRADLLLATDSLVVLEVVPFTFDGLPASLQEAFLGIAIDANGLVVEQSSQLGLANVDTVLSEVVVVAFDFVDTGKLLAVDVVGVAAILNVPAILQGIDQGVGVFKILVDILEVTALFAAIVGVDEGVQTKDFLVLRLHREGIQTAGTQINVIADLADIRYIQSVLLAPICIGLRRELDTVHNTQRVSSLGIESSGLVDPVHAHRHGIGFRIKILIADGEVIVDKLDVADIHIKILIKGDFSRNLCQHADAFCQLHQEGPGRSAFHVSARQHVSQLFQAFRHGDLRHIHGDDIGGNHVFIRILDEIGAVVFRGRVGHMTVPGQQTVAAGRLVKVEAVLALLVQRHIQAGRYRRIGSQSGVHLHSLQAGICHDEGKAFHAASGLAAQGEVDIVAGDGHFLAIVKRLQGQRHGHAVNSVDLFLGEVDLIGIDDVQRLVADDYFAVHQIDVHSAQLLGHQHAVLGDRGPGFIRHSPGRALGQIHLVASGAQAGSGYLDGGANGQVIHVRLQQRMVELRGAGSKRVRQQRGADGTRSTVRGTVHGGQEVIARLAGNEGGRTAAVQVDGMHAARLKHDLSDFLHAAAGREGLLTAVQNHHNDLASLGDTHSRTGRAAGVVVAAGGNGHLAVLHQDGTKAADGFLHLVCIGIPFALCTDHGTAILQNGEETIGVHGLVRFAVHHQQSAGIAVAHVIAAGIGGNNRIEVGNVMLAILAAILCLHSICLVNDACHRPFGGIAACVVGHDAHVFTGHINGGNIVCKLLVIHGGSVVDLLGDTGGQHSRLGREHLVVGIIGDIHKVASQTAQVISEGIADSLAHHRQIGGIEFTGAFQGRDGLVDHVLIVHLITQFSTQADAAQTVVDQERGPLFIRQGLGEIGLHDGSHVAGLVVIRAGHLLHHIEGVQVTVHVLLGKQVTTARILAQVVVADIGHLLLKGRALQAQTVSGAQQVNQVACPAANVSVVHTAIVVVGNVHGAKHMAEVHPVAVGQVEVLEVLQARDLHALGFVLHVGVQQIFLCHDKLGKLGILVARHDTPGTGVVAFHASTDVLDHQPDGILAGVLLRIANSQLLQQGQVLNELGIAVDDGFFQLGDLFIAFLIGTTGTGHVLVPANLVVSGLLGRNHLDVMAQLGSHLLFSEHFSANGAVRAFRQAGILAHGGFRVQNDHSVTTGNDDLIAGLAAGTAGSGLQSIGFAGSLGDDGALIPIMAQSRNHNILPGLGTAGAGSRHQAIGGTGSLNGHLPVGPVVARGRNNLLKGFFAANALAGIHHQAVLFALSGLHLITIIPGML